MPSNPGTPRSRSSSRPKRSTTNLRDLRLAPLSSAFAENNAPRERLTSTSPHGRHDEALDAQFARQHPSYLQGKSAPTTPGILSRSSNRRLGLSRRGSLHDETEEYFEREDDAEHDRTEIASVQKGKGEAALMAQLEHLQSQQSHSARGYTSSTRTPGARTPGTRTPGPRPLSSHMRSKTATSDSFQSNDKSDSWLLRTGATTSALLQESKGQSWFVSHNKPTARSARESEDEDEDDQYEEMAALSASTAKLQLAGDGDGASPISARASQWGSRYGSRSASRRSSFHDSAALQRPRRRSDGMLAGHNPPLRPLTADPSSGFKNGPRQAEQDEKDQREMDRLTAARSFGLGNLVDSVMNFGLFRSDEGGETSDEECSSNAYGSAAGHDESQEQARERMAAEAKRRREEKERLLSQPPPAPIGRGSDQSQQPSGWQDLAWLLSVASKIVF